MAKRGLGKGLEALIPENNTVTADSGDNVVMLKLSVVEPNKDQPRKNFEKDKLEALCDSIKEHGVIQPIIVIQLNNGNYQIVAGERRWRASRMAGLKEIPAIVRSYDKISAMQIALIENLQREDLNPVEEALGYQSLMDEFGMTQEDVAVKVGKSRSAVANSLRLLSLPKTVQKLLEEGAISSGHARAVLAVNDVANRDLLIDKIISDSLSVRQTEALVKTLNEDKPKPQKKNKRKTEFELQLEQIQNRISANLGTKVKIVGGEKKGKIEIEYYGSDDLNRVLDLLKM